MTIDEIQAKAQAIWDQINELHKQRAELEEQLKEAYVGVIQTLAWAKDVKFGYQEGMAAYGFKEHNLIFRAPESIRKQMEAVTMGKFNGVTIMGTDKQYMQNLMLRKNEHGSYQLTTCNVDLLTQFFEKSGGKIDMSFSDFKKTVELMNRIAAHAA